MAFRCVCMVLLYCTYYVYGAAELKWQNDVYTGRHLYNLITFSTGTDGYVGTPTILFMYAPACQKKALLYMKSIRSEGPPEHFVTVVKHDYETVSKHIWYDLDQTDDLKRRFIKEGDDCLKVLFFQAGYHMDVPFVWQNSSDVTLIDWAWSFLLVNIEVTNSLPYAVTLYAEGNGKKHFLAVIDSHQHQQVQTHFTRAILFYNTKQVIIYAKAIIADLSFDDWSIELTPEKVLSFIPWRSKDWLRNMRNVQATNLDYKWLLQWKLAEAQLITFKQPIMVERFTEKGYMKTKIPPEVYKELKTFYDNNQDRRLSEGVWDNMEPSINTDSVQTSMVPLTDTERASVGEALLEQMEKWCDCELEQTAFYGIREYYHGNVLRMHVDNVETHIISSILIIHKDHMVKENWDLEIIDFNGERQTISLEMGEMLLYESGTLIHGRPLPYKGRIFANCFLHYKPLSGWKWRRYYEKENEPIITDGVHLEPVDIVDTPFTLREEFRPKDEL